MVAVPAYSATPTRRFLLRGSTISAIFVAAFAAVAYWGIPALDSSLSFRDTSGTHDTVRLQNDVTFTPPAGWVITDGAIAPAGTPTADLPADISLTRGPTTIHVDTIEWSGTSRALLQQIRKETTALDRASITGKAFGLHTDSDVPGYLQRYQAAKNDGLVGAFAAHGTGVRVIVQSTTSDPDHEAVDEVGRLLTSISTDVKGN